jgi:hypothetical protein
MEKRLRNRLLVKGLTMHMQDWNTYRQQIIDGVGGLSKLSPETVKGYATLNSAEHWQWPSACAAMAATLFTRPQRANS